MKINHPASTGSLLPADFAPRVIERVSRIKRRRTLRRRAIAVSALLAIAVGAFLGERHELAAPFQPTVALQSPSTTSSSNEAVSYQEQAQPAINMFLPDTYLMTNFEDSTGESSWHSYDSWWSSNS